jgi:molybdate transport system substrate-binding protein
MKYAPLKLLPVIIGLLFNPDATPAAEVHLYAAASLSDALKKIGADYRKESDDKVIFNFAASSLLARQIQEGAPADVFFSADEEKMDDLQKWGLVMEPTRKSMVSNSLVVVQDKGSPFKLTSPNDLAGAQVRRLALAETKSVPAGIYARVYLERAGLWDKLAPKVIPTENVRGALAAVEAGNAEAAIVYKTDALISRKVRIAYEIPLEEGPRISYPVAVVTQTRNLAAAMKLVKHFQSPAALSVFEEFGFRVGR